MTNKKAFDPQRLLNMLCLLVLAFIPLSMLVSPVLDFLTIENRVANWTVTISAFAYILALTPLLLVTLFFLKSRSEKLFLGCAAAFFLYALLITLYLADDLFYPLYGLTSLIGAALIGTAFYVSVRDDTISPMTVFYCLGCASAFVLLPLLLVHIDIDRFAWLSESIAASSILYGYENPRAVGWVSTLCLSFLAVYLSTQPKGYRINPILLALIIVSATTLFWSGSRGGVVAFTISVAFVFSLSPNKNGKGLIAVLLCLAVAGAVSYFLHLPNGSYGIFSRIDQNLEHESVDALSSGRIELWKTTIAYILERPFAGYGYMPHKSLEGFNHGSAHNIILDVWLWFGVIIGTLVALAGIAFWIMSFMIFRKANDPYVSALFCMVTTLLIYSMYSGPYARTFPLLLFAVASGVLFGLRSSKRTETQI